jgi:hypothetical protein
MTHARRPIKPGRLFSAKQTPESWDFGPSTTDHELDPRNDYTSPDEQYELEVLLARRRQQDRQKQQEQA